MTPDSKQPSLPPSFSTARRWKIGLDTVLRIILVLAVVVMANYIGCLFSRQFYLSSQTRIHLSPRTVSVLQTLTNHVDVTIYCSKDDFGMYSTVMALLNEYQRLDPRISVKVVDYARDPAAAAQIQQKYNLISSASNNGPPEKTFIIFDCAGKFKAAPSEALVQYGAVGMTKDKKNLDIRPIKFNGEKMFTSMLLAVTRPKPFTAYFLQGDGEPSLADSRDNGYIKFGEILREDYINIIPFSLSGDEDVPPDCDLLIIAGPHTLFPDAELNRIDHYLSQGGRLMVLLDYDPVKYPTGLENFLARWGVNVGMDLVQDPNSALGSTFNIVVEDFNTQHPVVNSLAQSKLELILPRPVSPINSPNPPADAPVVTVLAQSGPHSVLYNQHGVPPRPYPLMVAVEQNSAKGLANPNGGMRMVVVGDSLFLDNQIIEGGANRDFAGYAVNWLLDRPTLLTGIGPSQLTEFRLLMTQAQMRNVRWLLLALLPGIVLAFGGLVWLRRRK
ncbi:MAG TPA: Gldg family protein [Candidatus Acidoferrales bacterium]|jgi:ABC-type uncharacterized transport system involved in gliding motility auxiliary subunit|nr:Gldg family protein [Candidatus Acidoferrales bacterium]